MSSVIYSDYDRVEGESEIWSFLDNGCTIVLKDEIVSGYYKIEEDELTIHCELELRYYEGYIRKARDIYGHFHIIELNKKNMEITGYIRDDNTDYGGNEKKYSMTVDFIRI